AGLAAMPQIVVREGASNHGFAHRDGADADAGVMAPLGHDFDFSAIGVDGAPWRKDRRGGLDRKARDDRLARRNAAEDAAGLVGKEARAAVLAGTHLVCILLAGQARGLESAADLDTLDGIDRHEI